MVAEKYGISIYWLVKTIRDQLVDVETTVPGVDKKLAFEYFFKIEQSYFRTPDISEANLTKVGP